MSTNLLRDNFDFILLVVLEDGAKYGLEIIAVTKARTDSYFDLKEGSLYPALSRLEKAGYVEVSLVQSNTGGPPRRYHHLTEAGCRKLFEKRLAWIQFNGAIDMLQGEPRNKSKATHDPQLTRKT